MLIIALQIKFYVARFFEYLIYAIRFILWWAFSFS